MKKWSWKAILTGLAIKLFGGQLAGWFIFRVIATLSHDTDSIFFNRALYTTSTSYLVVALLVGNSLNLLAGYLVAAWAPSRKIGHASILGLLAVIMGFLMLPPTTASAYPLWFQFSRFLTFPMILCGSWWRIKTHGTETIIKPTPTGIPPIASPFGD